MGRRWIARCPLPTAIETRCWSMGGRCELRAWQPRATCVWTEPDAISAGLSRVAELVDDRYWLMEANGATSWPVSTATRTSSWWPTSSPLSPPPATSNATAPNTAALRHVLERGRAAGVVVVAAIQRPAADVLPTSVRDLVQLRIVHATADRTSTEMAAGAAWMTSPAHTLPVGPQQGGLCFAVLEGAREGRLARTYWTTPEQAETLAVRTASYRPPWVIGATPQRDRHLHDTAARFNAAPIGGAPPHPVVARGTRRRPIARQRRRRPGTDRRRRGRATSSDRPRPRRGPR